MRFLTQYLEHRTLTPFGCTASSRAPCASPGSPQSCVGPAAWTGPAGLVATSMGLRRFAWPTDRCLMVPVTAERPRRSQVAPSGPIGADCPTEWREGLMDAPTTQTPPTGLTDADVSTRVARGHTNATGERTSRSFAEILRANVFTRFNLILGVLLAAIFVVGQLGDALFGIVL